MEILKLNELTEINGGTDWHGWLVDTAGECGCAAAATSELPPVGIGLAIAGTGFFCAAAIYDAWH